MLSVQDALAAQHAAIERLERARATLPVVKEDAAAQFARDVHVAEERRDRAVREAREEIHSAIEACKAARAHVKEVRGVDGFRRVDSLVCANHPGRVVYRSALRSIRQTRTGEHYHAGGAHPWALCYGTLIDKTSPRGGALLAAHQGGSA